AASRSVEQFASLLAEVRAYGEGLVVVEQIPSKLVPDVIKNSAVKVVHRLPALDDRETVGATMNVTDAQSEFLVNLQEGTAAVFTDRMDFPILTLMPDRVDAEKGSRRCAGPGRLVGRFSAACGELCQTAACSLEQMRRADRQL